MKKALFLIVSCSLIAACSTEKMSPSGDPIENLVSYLDGKDANMTHKRIHYEGGAILRTETEYYDIVAKPEIFKPEELTDELMKDMKEGTEIVDSCFRAFRWGCGIARQCYHKENHQLHKDTVLYALALDGMDGERIELQGTGSNEYLFAGYKAARAATLKVNTSKTCTEWMMKYITREETKFQEEAFNMRPLTDFIKWMMENTDSIKVYETCYEVTHEDFGGNPSLVGECYPDEEHTYCGKTTGHLYVVPESSAKDVQNALRFTVENDYIGLNPHQKFYIVSTDKELIIGSGEEREYSISKTYKHKALYSAMSVDGHFYILVLDETIGTFALPRCWKHIIRIKDHKEELIPGAHKPNKDGWID